MSTKVREKRRQQAQYYQIRVYGRVDPSWSEWFSGLELSVDVDERGTVSTRLTGTLPDQGALRGVLNRLWDLNLTLLSVKCKSHLTRRQ